MSPLAPPPQITPKTSRSFSGCPHLFLFLYFELHCRLGFVVPCIFSHSNKNTQLDATINRKIYCSVVQTLLNIVNKKVQLDATVCRHLFTAQSFYMFRVSQHPSSGVLKTVSATSGIGHGTGTGTSFHRGLIRNVLWVA